MGFNKDYPDAVEIKLEQNYRSTKKIIQAANEIIQNNENQRHKTLFTENEEGSNLKLYRASNEFNEAAFVAEEIEQMVVYGNHQYKDIAILFRNNSKSALFETAMNKNGIPNRVVSGQSFFQRREIKDILYYLRFLLDPNDPIFLREIVNVPKRGIGDTTINKIIELSAGKQIYDILENPSELKRINAKTKQGLEDFWKLIKQSRALMENGSLSVMVKKLLDELKLVETHYVNEERSKQRERKDNLDQFLILIREKEKIDPSMTLKDFIDEMVLFPVPEDDEEGYVKLMTMHASKGLEFPVVFIVGMDNDTFPSKRSVTEFDFEEERRLAYVAFTRAKESLYLTYPEEGYVRGSDGFKETRSNSPSPYIFEFDRKIMSEIRQRYI